MKESKKALPFIVAAFTALALFTLNPSKETHFARIKAEYVESNPLTWRMSWWLYESSLEHHDYLFFSVVKRKDRPISIGLAGTIVTIER